VPLPGDDLFSDLLNSFADVHYYISSPTQTPPHHRFDKSSYVYLYHNPMRQSGRIEVANHAGTPQQDAFAGRKSSRKDILYMAPKLMGVVAQNWIL
jgi:hypothetical protein